MLFAAALYAAQLTTTLLLLTGCDDPLSEGNADTTSTANKTSSGTVGLAAGKISGQIIASAAANVATIRVEAGPLGADDSALGRAVNTPFVAVTICAPLDPGNCQTIDHVVVDTASSGLRIVSSVLSSWLLQNLVKETPDYGSSPIAECWLAGDGFTWGSIRMADVHLSEEAADNIPIQVIGDPEVQRKLPQDCSASGRSLNTIQTLGFNGILGVGAFVQDCGAVCAQWAGTARSAKGASYYICPPESGCAPHVVGLSKQVANPVAEFRTDNNGVVVELPPIPPEGSQTPVGALVFGIDTRSNNTLGTAQVYAVDDLGYAVAMYAGRSYSHTVIDSRSPIYSFNDASIPQCGTGDGLYCPASTLSLTLVIQSQNGVNSTVAFAIANAENSLDDCDTCWALIDMGGTTGDPQAFGLGLPFFYGRNVFVGIDGRSPAGGGDPYVAF